MRKIAVILVAAIVLSALGAPAYANAETGVSDAALETTTIDPSIRKIMDSISLAVSDFTDVDFDDWAYEDIKKLVDSGFINIGESVANTSAENDADVPADVVPAISGDARRQRVSFRPDDNMTRAETAAVVAKLYEAVRGMVYPVYEGSPSYIDVPKDLWAYQYIEMTKRFLNDYHENDGNRYFMPDVPILRGDFITTLMKLTGGDVRAANYALLDRYSDKSEVSREWRAFAAIALEKDILNGYDDGTLGLRELVTRREACALIVRALAGTGLYEFPEPERSGIYIPNLDSGFYDTYYNDAVFVGDSITQGLMIYVLNQRARGNKVLGSGRFLAAQSYTLRAAAAYNPGGVNVSFQGVTGSLEDCLSRMGAKEVYIMLGMNDGMGSIERYETIVNKISGRLPNADINIEFCTPVTKSRERQYLNNANLDSFNRQIVEFCDSRGLDYVDISTAMKDGQNALRTDYSSDKYVHMNTAGSISWVKSLREFACKKYLTGEWSPGALPAAGAAVISPESFPGAYVLI